MSNEKRLIDANEFLEALGWADADVCEAYADCYCEWGFSRNAIEDLVQKQPTVDAVEVVHGRCKWCDGEYNTKIMATAIRYHTNGDMSGYELPVNYCPNCGAKMDGDGNG